MIECRVTVLCRVKLELLSRNVATSPIPRPFSLRSAKSGVRIPAILFSVTRFIRHSRAMPPVRLGPRDPVAKPKPNIAGFLDPAAAGLGMREWLCNAEFGL